ncbi:sugar transferase [Candidatus Nomurabacteria bacterium]|nr:sugar transferase [Candidatus Nomurabacteria bacterium]
MGQDTALIEFIRNTKHWRKNREQFATFLIWQSGKNREQFATSGECYNMTMQKRSEQLVNLLQVGVDFLAMLGGFVLAYLVRGDYSDKPFAFAISGQEYLKLILPVIPLWIIIFFATGLYTTPARGRRHQFGRLLLASLSSIVLTILIDYFTVEPLFPSKLVPVLAWVFAVLLLFIGRYFVGQLRQLLYLKRYGLRRAMIIASSKQPKHLESLRQSIQQDQQIVEVKLLIVDQLDREEIVDQVLQGVRDDQIDLIIEIGGSISKSIQWELVEIVHQASKIYQYLPTTQNLYQGRITNQYFGGQIISQIDPTPLTGFQLIGKRVFDTVFGLGALVLGFPVMILMAIVIKLSDPKGGVIYQTKRLGRGGKEIGVYKFRTMLYRYSDGKGYPNSDPVQTLTRMGRADLIPVYKRDHKLNPDPRINPATALFRRLGVDEWPQFVNVVLGQLSVVGPRPHLPDELNAHKQSKDKVLMIKPGLTGLWQVSGRNQLDYQDRLRLEIYYAEHWSPWLDIKIIIRTVLIMIRGGDGV